MINPNGPNKVEIFDNQILLVIFSTTGTDDLNSKISPSALHHRPDVFTANMVSASKSKTSALSSFGIKSDITLELVTHFLACIPADFYIAHRSLYCIVQSLAFSLETPSSLTLYFFDFGCNF